jgi:hypothetical protein
LALTLAGCDREDLPTSSASALPDSAFTAQAIDLMDPAKAAQLKALLPGTDDAALSAIFANPRTMWYDADSLKHVYQDSVTPILGVRANSIGRELAVDGQKVFNTTKSFHFPFDVTAGMTFSDQTYNLNFWSLPERDGQLVPVAWYQDDTTRWRWLFPVGTTFGEVMFLKDPQGALHVYEIRTRKRYADGWEVNAFRPFLTAPELAGAIVQRRPNWQSVPKLKTAVEALRSPATLTAKRLTSQYYTTTFEAVDGSLDAIPDLGDDALVKDLLTTATFRSAEGKIWKQAGDKETYAASTAAAFSIVPKDYQGGLYPVNEVSCNRCHQDTGRQIGEFSFNSLLYGEIWGEDRIFTWHLFDESGNFYGAYDRNRIMNRRFEAAGLVVRYEGGSDQPNTVYKELPRRFRIIYR